MSDDDSGYVLFAWTPGGWLLREQQGEPPAVGEQVDAEGARLVVTKLGPSPLPGDRRPCAYTTSA